MNVHGPVENVVIPVANLVHERLACLDAAFGPRQGDEQIELDRCQHQRFLAQNGHARTRIDAQRANHNFPFFGLNRTRRAGAPHDRS